MLKYSIVALKVFLSTLTVVSAGITIHAYYPEKQWQKYLFKPLTTFLIFLLAWLSDSPPSPLYHNLILLGLLFSLGGDIFLMLPKDMFLAGLVSFLVAHICYIVAFGNEANWQLSWGALLLFLIAGILVGGYLWQGLGKMKLPASIYIATILLMGWMGVNMWLTHQANWSLLAVGGALLFIVSDSALAINRFRHPFHIAQLIVLTTYYAAQWLIALSTYTA